MYMRDDPMRHDPPCVREGGSDNKVNMLNSMLYVSMTLK